MMINRRKAIQQFLFVSAGVAFLPACFQDDKSKSSVLLKNLQVSGQQEKNLASLTETIIPSTATPGARDVSAHLFVLKMLDDCFKKDDQQKYLRGMEAFEKAVTAKFDKPFNQCSQADRESVLTGINGKKDAADDLSFFYFTTKKLTIQAYTTSKFYLTKLQVYKMVPGKYRGCVPVKNNSTTNA
jgi:hypothetical protein